VGFLSLRLKRKGSEWKHLTRNIVEKSGPLLGKEGGRRENGSKERKDQSRKGEACFGREEVQNII